MVGHSLPLPFLALVATFLSILFFCLTNASKLGFTVDLIHIDSPNSPFYNPSKTPAQRFANALHRSVARSRHFMPNSSSKIAVQSNIITAVGEYVMRYSLGTPPLEILGIVDTGSDLIWSQCQPCAKCYKQEAPLFNPTKSTTHKRVHCSSNTCKSLQPASSCSGNKPCQYSVVYGDQSYSNGDLARDTITLGSNASHPVSFPKMVIGCGYNNEMVFEGENSGIVGLGGGPLSLVSQLGPSIDYKFSYCLVPLYLTHKSSKLNFGTKALVSGRETVSTPIVSKNQDTFYYLILEAMSVGNKKFPIGGALKEGNIIIDSGQSWTELPLRVYTPLEKAVSESITLPRVAAPSGSPFSLCYKSISKSDTIDNAPIITAHFTGANVWLRPINTFVRVSDEAVCFAITGTQGLSVFGNLAQMNFLIGYDLRKKIVSFKAADCTRL